MNPNLASPSVIRDLLSRHGIRLKKELGQHFLADGNILGKIMATIDPREDEVAVEVGAGIGILTCALAPRVGKLYAVELDRHLIPILEKNCSDFPNVEIVSGDFIELSLGDFGDRLLLVGNLPFGITSGVLLKLVRERERVGRAVYLVQWEVAEKLIAPPGRDRSRLGLHLRAFFDVTVAFRVSRNSFFPPPEVDGGLIRLIPLPAPRISVPDRIFEETLRMLFSARRKTLRRVLASWFGNAAAAELLAELGLDPRARAEALPLKDLDRIARWLYRRGLLALNGPGP
jgi:16S rRNA (adenine1518-N6/adenine1519-N6)-dimethyltransferase